MTKQTEKLAEKLASAAGINLDLSKERFIISKKMLVKLILTIHNNEYVRGSNNRLCNGCACSLQHKMVRRYDEPDKTWEFCVNCPHKTIMMTKGKEFWEEEVK